MKKGLIFFFILLLSCGDKGTNLNPTSNKGLSLFVLNQSQLPNSLSISSIDTNNTFCNFVRNPQLSSEISFTECIAGMMFGDTSIVKGKVIEALHSVFRDTTEIGITGFQFTDSLFAAECYSKIIQSNNFYTIRKKCIVVILWDDGVSYTNHNWIKSFIDSKSLELSQ